MCTLAFAYQAWPGQELVLVANRDEFYARASAPLSQWEEAPSVLAGRDLKAGGTWLGVTRTGRFATLTNMREPARFDPQAPSRGALVSDFLIGADSALDYLHRVAEANLPFNGFNLLCFDGQTLAYYSNRVSAPRALAPGLYTLSNATLDVPWPKAEALRSRFGAALAHGNAPDPDRLIQLLADPQLYPDALLPSTGVPIELERILSALHITSPHYGTVCSTVLTQSTTRLHLTELGTNPTAPAPRVELSLPLA